MSAAVAAAAAAVTCRRNTSSNRAPSQGYVLPQSDYSTFSLISSSPAIASASRYESQKRRDWSTFVQYLRNHQPALSLSRCSGANVLEFMKYLDQFGKTKVHVETCPFFGETHPPAGCSCPLKQAWGSLDALIGRLRVAFEENGGKPETSPFGERVVRIYLREVRDVQARARGINVCET